MKQKSDNEQKQFIIETLTAAALFNDCTTKESAELSAAHIWNKLYDMADHMENRAVPVLEEMRDEYAVYGKEREQWAAIRAAGMILSDAVGSVTPHEVIAFTDKRYKELRQDRMRTYNTHTVGKVKGDL
jgi:hypothetical protein